MPHTLSLAYDQSPQKSHPSLTVVMSTTKLSPRTAAEQAVQQAPASPPPVSLNTTASPQLPTSSLTLSPPSPPPAAAGGSVYERSWLATTSYNSCSSHKDEEGKWVGTAKVSVSSHNVHCACHALHSTATTNGMHSLATNSTSTTHPPAAHTTTTPRSLMAPCSHVRVHKLPQQHALAHGPRLLVPSRLQAPGQP